MVVECYYTNEFVNILQVQQIERLEHLFCCVLVTGSNVQQLGHSNQSKLLNSLHHLKCYQIYFFSNVKNFHSHTMLG